MEETNYRRTIEPFNDPEIKVERISQSETLKAVSDPVQETNHDFRGEEIAARITPGSLYGKGKQYSQKLRILDKDVMGRPNRLKGMALRPLIFLTFPVIFYAGFCYGSNLVWFNVLNGTASLILSKEPYAFSSSMVGLSYLSPLLGGTLGLVRSLVAFNQA